VLLPTFAPAPSVGPQAALADDGAAVPTPQNDDPSVPVESVEPGQPTEAPGAGGGAVSANQAAALSGIVVAGVAVTGLAALYLIRSTSAQPKPDQPIPPMIGGSRMSTGAETLSADSRPSSPHHSATVGQSQPLHSARLRSSSPGHVGGTAERRASTLATGFHEQPILEETIPMFGGYQNAAPLRDAATGAAIVAGATMARAGLDQYYIGQGEEVDGSPSSMRRGGRSLYSYRSLQAAPPGQPPPLFLPAMASTAPSLVQADQAAEYSSPRWTRAPSSSSVGLDPEGDTLDASESSHVMAD
jgi:hypothetical protein